MNNILKELTNYDFCGDKSGEIMFLHGLLQM